MELFDICVVKVVIRNQSVFICVFTSLFEKAQIELKVQSLKLFSDVASVSIQTYKQY